MRLSSKRLFALLCAGCSISSAIAAESIDIKVSGKIIPPACSPSFISGGGVADFGNIHRANLSSISASVLPDIKTLPVRIQCDAPARFGITFTDNRKESASDTLLASFRDGKFSSLTSYYFGLGLSQNKQIGVYGLAMTAMTNQNAKLVYSLYSRDTGKNWTISPGSSTTSVPISNEGTNIYGFANSMSASEPDAHESINFNVQVSAIIQPLNTLDFKDEITLDGLTSINLVYI